MSNKDIYEILNEIDYDIRTENEIELTDIEKKLLKKNTRKRLDINRTRNNYKVIISVAIITLIIVSFGMSPWGRSVIAEIKEKLIFTPSHGLIGGNENEDLYVFENPKRVSINENEILVKSISNNGEYIYVHFQDVPWDEIENIKSYVTLKTQSNNFIKRDSNSGSGSGNLGNGLWDLFIGFNQGDDLITNFDLCYKDEVIGDFELKKVEVKNGYNEIGGNSIDKDILIGATSYYIEDKRCFKTWTNIENIETDDYNMQIGHIDDIEVRDDKGNILEIQGGNDGTGRSYELLSDYKGNLNINIKEIALEYNMKNAPNLKLDMPKDGEIIELDKEIEFKGIDNKVRVTSIENNNNDNTISFKFSKNENEDRYIYMISPSFKNGHGSMGDIDLLIGEFYVDTEDLTLIERLTGKINIKLDKISIMQEGNWQFTIE